MLTKRSAKGDRSLPFGHTTAIRVTKESSSTRFTVAPSRLISSRNDSGTRPTPSPLHAHAHVVRASSFTHATNSGSPACANSRSRIFSNLR